MSRSDQELLAEVQPMAGFNNPLTYGYSLKLAPLVQVGSIVKIPLGPRRISGVVFSLNPKEKPDPSKLKFISSVVQEEQALSTELISLARWMTTYYSSSMENVLECMIPAAIRDGMQAKTERTLILTSEGMNGSSIDLSRAPKQKILLDFLKRKNGQVTMSSALKELKLTESVATGLVHKGFAEIGAEVVERKAYDDEFEDFQGKVRSEITLTPQQSNAAKEIIADLKNKQFGVRLLLGVTGSGKTEVYLEAMKQVLEKGGGVLFLVPEVSLAPQTVSRIRHYFSESGEEVVVWHSHLSAGERLDAWRNLSSGKARIAVGARSAVFAPIHNLRLIVVDEEHESAYKQEDSPRYHGRDVAVYRSMLNQATCVLGSATPSMETLRNVEKNKYLESRLDSRIDGRELPLVHVVDMRREAQRERTPPILSQPLVESLRQRYADREQSILFLNRRGFNTTMLCPDCGYVEQCKDCSIALTFHRTDGFLKCHLCGYRKNAPMICPSCQSLNIRKKGHGTQRIEDLVSSLMPKRAKVVRVDADMAYRKNALRSTLQDFRRGKIDVLVGTQMIAKGLDFPNVTLVGVIDADLPLRMEDFRASERAFQLLVQVAGRAGRGDRAGEVYVQSYAPHSPSIQFARKSDLRGFMEEEMELRRELGYPPFRSLIRHLFRGRSSEKTEFYTQQWANSLNEKPIAGLSVRGPAPAPLEKMKGLYRHHLFYFTNEVSKVVRELEERRRSFPLDREVHDILDVDAQQIH